MKLPALLLLASLAPVMGELTIPANTAYGLPNADALHFGDQQQIVDWLNPAQKVAWYGQFSETGELTASVEIQLPKSQSARFRLTLAGKSAEAAVAGEGALQKVSFGKFTLGKPGYQSIQLEMLDAASQPAMQIGALSLDGPATDKAHFNLKERRNAASVHLAFPVPESTNVAAFYHEITAVEDPLYTYYMACGFSRGYLGMQVNSPTERRLIFSVWDSGNGDNAQSRANVAEEHQTKLLAKGEGVEASVFGNEGTGGHSHLVYPWKTGSTQKFLVTAKPDGTFTTYTGYWFHPEQQAWMLLASFRAPHDGQWLKGLYSFSENFGGQNGHLLRKARFGPEWIQDSTGKWQELLEAHFSHDGTGQADRLDRFMGVEEGRFFLSHGGYVEGFTKYGAPFHRPATNIEPKLSLPEIKP